MPVETDAPPTVEIVAHESQSPKSITLFLINRAANQAHWVRYVVPLSDANITVSLTDIQPTEVFTLTGAPVEHEMGAIMDVTSKKEVKVAIETFPPALVYNNSTIEKVISLIPSKYRGWNLDPSHQVYQFIDYFESIRTFKNRIFHVHAKDAEILYDRLRFTGIHGKE